MTPFCRASKHVPFAKSGNRISPPSAVFARSICCTKRSYFVGDWSDLAEDHRILRAGHRRQVSRTAAYGFNGQQGKRGGLLRKGVDAIEGNRCRHGGPEGPREIFHKRAV